VIVQRFEFEKLFYEYLKVKKWQKDVKDIALDKGWTQTLIGRYRNLSKMLKSKSKTMVNHALRACINTPIQVFF